MPEFESVTMWPLIGFMYSYDRWTSQTNKIENDWVKIRSLLIQKYDTFLSETAKNENKTPRIC